jgi:hypothetical protein
MPRPRITTVLALTAATGFGIGAATLAYFMVRANITESVYRQRLEEVAARYENLREQYNDAVRRTAVTELVVTDGHLSVRIRNAAGVIEDIPTDYDPRSEIFVDYAIVDGRLWIRRVFDALTPPSNGLLIDPQLAGIDWDAENTDFGKAVYRSLGEGRWVITASGDGSLALRPAEDDLVTLETPPTLGSFEEMNEQLEGEIANISPADIWHALWND